MSFHHAPVTKGLLLGCGLVSITAAVFDVKHYLHLQFAPHISRHHQYWRLISHQFACANSSDLLITEILLYNVAIQVERQFGSVKFASFAVISLILSMILEFASLLLFHRFGLNHLPSGPTSLLFNILYQYSRLVPSAYQFHIFGISVTDRIYIYILAAQLVFGPSPGSVALALIGVVAGQLYRSDLVGFKTYRLPPRIIWLGSRYLLPMIGSTRAPRRSNRAIPEARPASTSAPRLQENDETITTAPSPPTVAVEPQRPSVMREWVNELTGRADRTAGAVRFPSEEEITQVRAMFPDSRRDDVVATLQRSPNTEAAVEALLAAQTV